LYILVASADETWRVRDKKRKRKNTRTAPSVVGFPVAMGLAGEAQQGRRRDGGRRRIMMMKMMMVMMVVVGGADAGSRLCVSFSCTTVCTAMMDYWAVFFVTAAVVDFEGLPLEREHGRLLIPTQQSSPFFLAYNKQTQVPSP
jgi:hypothetical protein